MGSYVRMTVAAEAYAMPVEHVLEAAGLGRVRAVPGARRELLGIRTLRGQILPVVDLARLLGVHRTAAPTRLLVAEARGFRVGFAIDEVNGIGDLGDLAELGETGELGMPAEGAESGLLAGATLSDGELVGVLDVPRVFDSLDGTRR
ncbi:MAG: chemotaxis protein CheW [Streptosporangiaceae bacterium]